MKKIIRTPRRIFRRVFLERSIHPSGLAVIRTLAWWDSDVLLVETVTETRNNSRHDWSEPEARTSVHTNLLEECRAIRLAIKLHDACKLVAFADLERACAEMGDEGDDEPAAAPAPAPRRSAWDQFAVPSVDPSAPIARVEYKSGPVSTVGAPTIADALPGPGFRPIPSVDRTSLGEGTDHE